MQEINVNNSSILTDISTKLSDMSATSNAPLISTFNIKGKPLSLKYHYPMAPLFKKRKPRRTVVRCARQIGKCCVLSKNAFIVDDFGYPCELSTITKDLSLITYHNMQKANNQQILGIFDNGVQKALRICLASGNAIEVTYNHKIRVSNGYVEASTVKSGDILILAVNVGRFGVLRLSQEYLSEIISNCTKCLPLPKKVFYLNKQGTSKLLLALFTKCISGYIYYTKNRRIQQQLQCLLNKLGVLSLITKESVISLDIQGNQPSPAFREVVVVSAEDIGEQPTIDLEVANDHNFLLNNIVVHNSISIAADGILTSRTTPYLHSLFVQPRYEQIKRFSNIYTKVMIETGACPDIYLDYNREQSISQRSLVNGSDLYFSYAFLDPDRCRGFSFGKLFIDESLIASTLVNTYNRGSVKILDIKKGDILDTVTKEGYITQSVTDQDASYHGNRRTYKVTLTNGDSITGTSESFIRTDKGWFTIGGLITYGYKNKEFYFKAGTDDFRDIVRRQISTQDQQVDLVSSEQPLMVSERVQHYQTPDIIKACKPESREEYERGLNNLLHLLTQQSFPNLKAYTQPNISGMKEQKETKGVFKKNYKKVVKVNISSITYEGYQDVYDISVVGTKNFFANNINVHNCQDVKYDFIPIIGEGMSAETEYGFYMFSGTPKSHQNTLNKLFEMSSQGFQHIFCTHCNAENIPNAEHHIYKMIGKDTCICYKCGRPLDLLNSKFIHHYPNRRSTFEGYHISQVTHPLHACIVGKWHELLHKYETYSESVFANEILGLAADTADKPITEADLKEACGDHVNDISQAAVASKGALMSVLGVDWSGFGAGQNSTTAMANVVSIPNSDIIKVIYLERIKYGISPEEESKKIIGLSKYLSTKLLSHDYTGAGMIREALINQLGFPAKHIIPFSLVSAPVRHKIIEWYKPTGGVRSCYNIDKARSLTVLCQMIKKKKIIFPSWSSCKNELRDLLNLTQETRETASKGSLLLLDKEPGTTDDFAHALNFACSTIWHSTNKYPRLATTLTEEDYEKMDPDGYNKIVEKTPNRSDIVADTSKSSHKLDW